MTKSLTDYKALTFDCYGTLIDWESGIWDALQPLLLENGRSDIYRVPALSAFAEEESAQQARTPDMLYPDILQRVHGSLAARFGMGTTPEMDAAFQRVLENHTAGSPMDETVKWTNLTREEIATGLEEEGFSVSVTIVDQLLANHNFRRRQAFKAESGKQVPQRDEQFQNIASLKQQYHEQGNPVMSMDVKKKR